MDHIMEEGTHFDNWSKRLLLVQSAPAESQSAEERVVYRIPEGAAGKMTLRHLLISLLWLLLELAETI